MRVEIKAFKSHLDSVYEFQENSLTLVKGQSGCGKSTLLQAIFWALYGNMRGIYNNARISKALSVTLYLPGITICRKKNPELLSVTVYENSESNKIYEDEVAQSIIDGKYGNRELWKACSYIEQKGKCSLLSGSASERMDLLNALSFTGENPKDFINKINERLKDVTNEFTISQASFTTEVNLYSQGLTLKPVTVTLSSNDINMLEEEIKMIESSLSDLHLQVMEQERLQGSKNYLMSLINKLKCSFPPPSPSHPLNVINIPNELYIVTPAPIINNIPLIDVNVYQHRKKLLTADITAQASLISQKNLFTQHLQKIDSQITSLISFINSNTLTSSNFGLLYDQFINGTLGISYEKLQEEAWKLSKLEAEREKNFQDCKSLGIEYDEIIIKNNLQKLQDSLNHIVHLEKYLPNYQKLQTLEKSLFDFKASKSTVLNSLSNSLALEEQINGLEGESRGKVVEISELKKGLEMLTCPNCTVPLRYVGGKLNLGDRHPVSHDQIKSVEKEYLNINSKIEVLRNIMTLENNIKLLSKSIEVPISELQNFLQNNLSSQKIKLQNLITKLASIKFISPSSHVSVNSENLTNLYNYLTLLNNKADIENKIGRLEIPEVENKIRELEELENGYVMEQERIKNNQILVSKHQETENKRMKELNRLETLKRNEEQRYCKEKEMEERVNHERSRLEKEIAIKEQELLQIESQLKPVREEYLNLQNLCKVKKERYEAALYGAECVKRGKELEAKREKLIELQNDMIALQNLKTKAVEIECKQLEDTVNNINSFLETTLPIFFPDPIEVKLLLYKEIKAKKGNYKPGLNLEISYKGMMYDNINSLSGGEESRVNLAMLLALGMCNNSPLLMLDECVSSLDANLKESCLEAIKLIPNKTIICVDHDEVLNGFYDQIIDMSA